MGPVLASMFASGTNSALGSVSPLPAGAGSLAAGVCAADNAGNANAKAIAHTTSRQRVPT
jgi:hypothetical protein